MVLLSMTMNHSISPKGRWFLDHIPKLVVKLANSSPLNRGSLSVFYNFIAPTLPSYCCIKSFFRDFHRRCDRFIWILMKTKHPVHIMVFGMVTSNVDIMPPFMFPCNFIHNTEAYIRYLEEVVLPGIENLAAGRLYIWQQDFVPCHQAGEPSLGSQKISATTSSQHLAT